MPTQDSFLDGRSVLTGLGELAANEGTQATDRWRCLARARWSAALVILLSLVGAFPRIRQFVATPGDWCSRALEWQLRHPLTPIPAERFAHSDPESQGVIDHLKKRTYRITLPMVGWALGLTFPEAELAGALGALGLSIVLLLYVRRVCTPDPLGAFLFAVALGNSFIVQWGVIHSDFYDGFSYLLLGCTALVRNPIAIAALLAVAGFSDERTVLAAPLIYLLQSNEPLVNMRAQSLLKMNPSRRGVLAGLAVFALLRLAYGLHVGRMFDRSEVGLAIVQYNLTLLLPAMILVFKGSSLVIGKAVSCIRQSRSALLPAALVTAALPGLAVSLMVWDLSRSLAYLFPLILICVRVIAETSSRRDLRRVAMVAALTSVLLPTFYVLEGSVTHLPPLFKRISARE